MTIVQKTLIFGSLSMILSYSAVVKAEVQKAKQSAQQKYDNSSDFSKGLKQYVAPVKGQTQGNPYNQQSLDDVSGDTASPPPKKTAVTKNPN